MKQKYVQLFFLPEFFLEVLEQLPIKENRSGAEQDGNRNGDPQGEERGNGHDEIDKKNVEQHEHRCAD